MTPQVSVVMTVYNDLRFLDLAVDSILDQTFRDLELIIVDDGNCQDALFETLGRRDPRIRIVSNSVNLGTAAAANRGIATARSDVIVRIDADDIAEPNRIASLHSAFAEDPRLGLIGSAVTFIDEAGVVVGEQRMPESDLEIRWTILFYCPFYHSSVAFRRRYFEQAGGYRPHELVSQDHYLWHDMLPFCRARNLAAPLARYRLNPRGLVAAHSQNSRARTHAIREDRWKRIGLAYDIYDERFGLEITRFLNGGELAPAVRTDAYRVVLRALRAFLDAAQPVDRDDLQAARRLSREIPSRMFARPPPRLKDILTLWWLTWRIDRSAAVSGALAYARSGPRG